MSFSNLSGSSAVDMDSDEELPGHVTKKIKITANNGWEHVFARGGIKSRFTKTTAVDATEFLKNYRPRAQKQSLEILISLPLDILFEVTQVLCHMIIRDNHNRPRSLGGYFHSTYFISHALPRLCDLC